MRLLALVSSQLLVPFDSRQLLGRCSCGHSFTLLLSVNTLLGLIFTWVLLRLGFLLLEPRPQGQLPVQCTGAV